MRFHAVDVETANNERSSICQIGIATFENGELVSTYNKMFDPSVEFWPWNIRVHGITAEMVAGQPHPSEAKEEIKAIFGSSPVVSHSTFDRRSFQLVFGSDWVADLQWFDSTQMVKNAWPQFRKKGYGLKDMSQFLGLALKHHDASSDAIACGQIVMAAIDTSRKSIFDLSKPLSRPARTNQKPLASLVRDFSQDQVLEGQKIVFTGALSEMTRKEAKEAAFALGADVPGSLTKNTTILVLGGDDYQANSKYKKAMELIEGGVSIDLLSEDDFISLVMH